MEHVHDLIWDNSKGVIPVGIKGGVCGSEKLVFQESDISWVCPETTVEGV